MNSLNRTNFSLLLCRSSHSMIFPVLAFLTLLLFVPMAQAEEQLYCPNNAWLKFTPAQISWMTRAPDGSLSYPTGLTELDRIMLEYNVRMLRPSFTHDPISLRNPAFHELGMDRSYLFRIIDDKFAVVRTTQEIETLIDRIANIPGIEKAEPIGIAFAFHTPNDWATTGNMYGLDSMHCRQAWDAQRGVDSVLAVTIDTGVMYDHPDLIQNFQMNTAEDLNGDGRFTAVDSNGVDDDLNGFIDDVIGWDFVSHSFDEITGAQAADGEDYGPPDNTPSDVHGHGTHVCGSLAARTNNGVGIPAASYNIRTLGLRAGFGCIYNGGLAGVGFTDNFWPAIQYAVNRGARIISISFGGTATNTDYQNAILYARASNCLVFAAAGNNGNTAPRYPANYNGVMAVAATGGGNIKADFSNYGQWIDISAPGVSIWSTTPTNAYNPAAYQSWDGTSMASPNAASVAALALSKNPTLSDDRLEQFVLGTATNIDALNPGFEFQLGAGLINAQALINAVPLPVIAMRSPNGNEVWWAAQNRELRWMAVDSVDYVRIELDRHYPSGIWETIFASTTNDGSEFWTVAGDTTDSAAMRISWVGHPQYTDTTDGVFKIKSPWIQVTSPVGGETYRQAIAEDITWMSGGCDSVDVDINRNYPVGTWQTIASNIRNTGIFTWMVTGPASMNARIRVSKHGTLQFSDVSDSNFVLLTPGITMTAPDGGEAWNIGTVHQVNWVSLGTARVNIDIDRNYPSGTWERIVTSAISNGRYNWTVNGPESPNCRIRVSNTNDSTNADTSNASFSVLPSDILIGSPNGGENWTLLTQQTVRWTPLGIPTVRVELNRNYPTGTWEVLSATYPTASGSFTWNVAGTITGAARIRLVSTTNPVQGDTSDANFNIINPSITIVYPNGGESIFQTRIPSLSWSSLGVSGNVRIELNRNYPSGTWETLFASVANDGVQAWPVAGANTTSARLRITSISDPTVIGLSANNFTIADPILHVTSPNGSEVWPINQLRDIRWNSNMGGTVNIYLDRQYPSGQWQLLEYGTPNDGVFPWSVTGPMTSTARIRIVHEFGAAYADTSDSHFVIGTTAVREYRSGTPVAFALDPAAPNPFNPETNLRFAIPLTANVTVAVYNAMGQLVATPLQSELPAGFHSLAWRANNTAGTPLPSGVYFVVVSAGAKWQSSQKILLLR
ncbi:MAG: S8 family serine peptidase [bacterium]|nr:S8 family serine peptidase [bacterium]